MKTHTLQVQNHLVSMADSQYSRSDVPNGFHETYPEYGQAVRGRCGDDSSTEASYPLGIQAGQTEHGGGGT